MHEYACVRTRRVGRPTSNGYADNMCDLQDVRIMSCDIHTHTPAKKSSTNFQPYPFLLRRCYTNCLGHGRFYCFPIVAEQEHTRKS